MPNFLELLIGIILLTVFIVLISLLFGGIQYVMGKYGFQIVIGSFLAFVGWIAYGAFTRKK